MYLFKGIKPKLSEKEIDFEKRFADALKSFVYEFSKCWNCVFRIRVLDDPVTRVEINKTATVITTINPGV